MQISIALWPTRAFGIGPKSKDRPSNSLPSTPVIPKTSFGRSASIRLLSGSLLMRRHRCRKGSRRGNGSMSQGPRVAGDDQGKGAGIQAVPKVTLSPRLQSSPEELKLKYTKLYKMLTPGTPEERLKEGKARKRPIDVHPYRPALPARPCAAIRRRPARGSYNPLPRTPLLEAPARFAYLSFGSIGTDYRTEGSPMFVLTWYFSQSRRRSKVMETPGLIILSFALFHRLGIKEIVALPGEARNVDTSNAARDP